MRKILDGICLGECNEIMCDIVPHLCQEKMKVPAKNQKISHIQGNTEVETDSQLSCNFLTCTSSILGKFLSNQENSFSIYLSY